MLLLAVVSPIDYWADDYFFVHMIEHILIMFFAPILIVSGRRGFHSSTALPVKLRRRVGRAVLLGAWAAPLRAARAVHDDGRGRPSCSSTSSW